jgi:hypothetical protein
MKKKIYNNYLFLRDDIGVMINNTCKKNLNITLNH